MRVAVIGAGIVGVTTAFELAADGQQVTVFERDAGVATGTSFANAGVLAPGYVTPWAAPGMPLKVLRHLFSRHAPVRLGAGALGQLPWIWRWWRACRLPVHQANRGRMQRLAHYSRERMQGLTHSLHLEYEQADGYLVLLRGPRDLALAQGGMALLRELGVPFELLDAEGCRRVEPGLNAGMRLQAGIRLVQDGVGNCRQFAHLMRAEAERLGARFCFQQTVQRIEAGSEPKLHLGQSLAAETFDAVVVCAGLESAALLRPLGLRLPLVAVYGYSITAPLRHLDAHPDLGPRSALMDEKYKVAISRLGLRARVAGSAELGGTAQHHSEAAIATLYKVLNDWFPGAADLGRMQHWKGARPMLPDGPPVIGASGRPGVWLNLGHGSSGWALACGSARLLADRLGGRPPGIDAAGLDIERFG